MGECGFCGDENGQANNDALCDGCYGQRLSPIRTPVNTGCPGCNLEADK